MSTLRRFVSGIIALGFLALPIVVASPAAAEPTPSPSPPPCKAGSMKLSFPGAIAVAPGPDTWVSRSGTLQDTVGYYYKDLGFTFAMWPDKGDLGAAPGVAMVTSTRTTLRLRRVMTPRPMWLAEGIKPPTLFPGSQTFFRFEVSFPPTSVVTTYTTKLTVTAGVCGTTALGSSTAMKFGFMTDKPGNPPTSATPNPSASARSSAKPSAKASHSPVAGASQDDVAPIDGVTATEGTPEESAGTELASGPQEDGGSPLPWMAGLGLTALIVAASLIFWLRRTSAADDED